MNDIERLNKAGEAVKVAYLRLYYSQVLKIGEGNLDAIIDCITNDYFDWDHLGDTLADLIYDRSEYLGSYFWQQGITFDPDSIFKVSGLVGEWRNALCGQRDTDTENTNLCGYTQVPIVTDLVDQVLNEQQTEQQPTQEKETMNNAKTTVKNVVATNKNAVKTTATIAIGRSANAIVFKGLKKSKVIPMVARGYAETPIGQLVIANIVSLGVEQLAPNNTKLVAITQAMITSAMVQVQQDLNIEALIDDLLEKLPTGQLESLLTGEEK